MPWLPCPYLGAPVHLTRERQRHIARRPPDLLPRERHRLAETLADPDQVRRSPRVPSARLFSRWYTDPGGGKHVVVVVVTQAAPARHWVVTAYLARRLAGGEVEWSRS